MQLPVGGAQAPITVLGRKSDSPPGGYVVNPADGFDRYFDIVLANSEENIKTSQRLRYQVYCVEHHFEDTSGRLEGLEIDDYDARSVHSLIIHRESKQPVGTVRLVLADPLCPAANFPMEEHCSVAADSGGRCVRWVRRESLAEISRFAVSKEFRKRMGEPQTVHGITESTVRYGEEGQRRLFPHITMGLFKAILQMSVEHGITHWYAVMEPTLLRLLARFGIEFEPVGSLVQYHGWRQPCFAAADRVLAAIHRQRPEVWEFVTDAGKLWPAPSLPSALRR